jgi:hypothetical protein
MYLCSRFYWSESRGVCILYLVYKLSVHTCRSEITRFSRAVDLATPSVCLDNSFTETSASPGPAHLCTTLLFVVSKVPPFPSDRLHTSAASLHWPWVLRDVQLLRKFYGKTFRYWCTAAQNTSKMHDCTSAPITNNIRSPRHTILSCSAENVRLKTLNAIKLSSSPTESSSSISRTRETNSQVRTHLINYLYISLLPNSNDPLPRPGNRPIW